MIFRDLSKELLQQLKEYPIVTVLGPRQAGKTTLARELLKDYTYVSLETPDILAFAREDPRGFLARYRETVIFDEIQRAPHLISYLQGIVDDTGKNGQFVLTTSVTQSTFSIKSISQSTGHGRALLPDQV